MVNRVRRALRWGPAVAIVAIAAPLWADDDPLTLAWTAPATCPDEAAVVAEVKRLIGAARGARRHIAANGSIRADGHDFRVRLETEVDGVKGKRTLAAHTCASATDAAALILALMIDPQAVALGAAPPASSSSAPPPLPPPASIDPPSPPPPPASSSASIEPPPPAPIAAPTPPRIAPYASVGMAIDAGTLPRFADGVALGAGVRARRVSLEIAGTYWGPRAGEVPTAPLKGGHFQLLSAALRGCVWHRDASARIGPCGGLELEHLHGDGYGVVDRKSGGETVLAGTLAATTEWDISTHVSVRAELGAALPFEHRRFVLENVGAVYTPASVALRGAFGALVRF